MVNVETIDLSPRGVTFPSDQVGMVIAQPYVELSGTEPFRCTSVEAAQQNLTSSLQLALARPHGATKTHFTILPEYSIPGIAGVQTVDNVMRDASWPAGTVIVGGTDGLTKDEFSELVSLPGSNVDATHNAINRIAQGEWINCGIVWVKAANGSVERWLQPKLHPAWPEMDISYQSMFCGRSLFVFKGTLENGTPYRFATIICFDWIATVGTKRTCAWILEDLHQQANNNGQLPLSWIFVIQRNEKPSHAAFLGEVETFFDRTQFPNALRDRTCIIFANQASIPHPGRATEFGGCSVVLSPYSGVVKPECAPTYSNGGAAFREGSEQLSPYRDAFFRERGACIHSFLQINPGSFAPGPAGRSFAVEKPEVHPIAGQQHDPRIPRAPVPACIKWFNDELDQFTSVGVTYHDRPYAGDLDTNHQDIVTLLRTVQPVSVENAVKLAAQQSTAKNPDQWGPKERSAVEHFVNTLNVVTVGRSRPTLPSDPAHATLELQGEPIDLLAIAGNSHEECINHSKHYVPSPRRRSLLVSRDKDNNNWLPRFGSFLEPEKRPGDSQKITDPYSGVVHIGYRKLIDLMQASDSVAALQGAINDAVSA